MTVYSHCQICRDKLQHTALFCPKCGLSTCSWDCYTHHLGQHQHEVNHEKRGMPSAQFAQANTATQPNDKEI